MFRLNIRFVLKVLGLMHIIESFFMLGAAGVAFFNQGDDLYPLLLSCGIMSGAGILFYLTGRTANESRIGGREGMVAVSLTWTLFSFFGMMPFYLGGYIPSFTDAYLETMAGFTTTGSTVLNHIETLPRGILVWRSLTQWQGGIGIIVFTIALMPLFGGTAMQLFDAEISGITHEHFMPRVTQVAKRVFGIYFVMTCILILLLWAGPMDLFDAVNHGLTTISTGGYSTKDTSIAYWHSPYIEYVIGIFMCLGATNITLVYFTCKGNIKKLWHDDEFRWFYSIVFICTALVTVWLMFMHLKDNPEEAFRKSFFQVVSLITSTGFGIENYMQWGAFFTIIALMLMVTGGCAGSTAGGLKMGRFVILVKNMFAELKKQTHPNALIPVRVSGRVVPSHVVQRVQTFAFAYMSLAIVGCTVLVLDGLVFDEALGLSVSAIGNIGPAIGKYASGNYADLPVLSKWVVSFLMMTGRLEIFTILTILLPGFWKQ
ncbi:MAG: TrkH family potassium uptake protein [Tannerella sp.]|jgi:trk system potassium uptake protein TrkH|nr:TrkH family potassium uptake protein [Tannerella sp.]